MYNLKIYLTNILESIVLPFINLNAKTTHAFTD